MTPSANRNPGQMPRSWPPFGRYSPFTDDTGHCFSLNKTGSGGYTQKPIPCTKMRTALIEMVYNRKLSRVPSGLFSMALEIGVETRDGNP